MAHKIFLCYQAKGHLIDNETDLGSTLSSAVAVRIQGTAIVAVAPSATMGNLAHRPDDMKGR